MVRFHCIIQMAIPLPSIYPLSSAQLWKLIPRQRRVVPLSKFEKRKKKQLVHGKKLAGGEFSSIGQTVEIKLMVHAKHPIKNRIRLHKCNKECIAVF